MHQRRFAAFILGFWIAGSILISYITVRNQTGIDRALTTSSAGVAQVIDKLGMETSRMFLHFNAAEENEEYFTTWEIVQFILAILLAVVLYEGTHINRWWLVVPACMAVVVGFKHFV